MTAGRLWTVGVGPGDPELMTVKAARIIAAAPVVAFFAKQGRAGHARSIAERYIRADAEELRLQYPFTTECSLEDPRYAADMGRFYDEATRRMAERLDRGLDVALLCEGDPFFYGSSMYLYDRLGPAYGAEAVPGVTGMSGCWTRAGLPMLHGDDVLTVLPGTLPLAALTRRLVGCDAAVVMKVGRHLPKIRAALAAAGLLERAVYVERGTMAGEGIVRLSERADDAAPYFALVPGAGPAAAPVTGGASHGRLWVVGLGPGAADLLAPRAEAALSAATDLVGYAPYLGRVASRPGQRRHGSDNRAEIDRARHALRLAASGAQVAVVSSGDAGVFAMASAVFEAVETGEAAWRALEIEIVPGISAMFAAAARIGAPLGHDFCAISLSDNLKPWPVVSARLLAAARADFVLALYNPVSQARRWQLGAAFELLREVLPGTTPVMFATSVSRPEEQIRVASLDEADPDAADMRTLIIVGSRATRRIERPAGAWIYTPRGTRAA